MEEDWIVMGVAPGKIGYVVVEFPNLTETFILREMIELRNLGVDVRLFSLKTITDYPVHHQETGIMLERTTYSPLLLSWAVWKANLGFLFRRPGRYLSLWAHLVLGMRRSGSFLLKTVVLLPKCVRFARQAQLQGLERIHCHFARQPAVCGLVINWLTGIPFSMTPHAHDIFVDTVMLDDKLRRADMVVAISDYNRDYFLRICPDMDPDKIKPVRYGLRLEEYEPKTSWSIEGRVKILSVSALQEYKGIRFLIEACGLLRKRGLDFECTVIGDGELRSSLEAQIRKAGLEEVMLLPGTFPHHQVIEKYRSSDIFVLPSIVEKNGKMEGLPNVLIESLALGLPAVSTNIAGIPELVRSDETGLIVEEQDALALAHALERLISDQPLRERVAAAGREEVLKQHNIRTNVKKQLEFFSQCSGK
jgi:glycosyltransferase involved in cell wall biosynthesis